MGKKGGNDKISITVQGQAYFHSDTHINLESTDVKEILAKMISKSISKMEVGGILKR